MVELDEVNDESVETFVTFMYTGCIDTGRMSSKKVEMLINDAKLLHINSVVDFLKYSPSQRNAQRNCFKSTQLGDTYTLNSDALPSADITADELSFANNHNTLLDLTGSVCDPIKSKAHTREELLAPETTNVIIETNTSHTASDPTNVRKSQRSLKFIQTRTFNQSKKSGATC